MIQDSRYKLYHIGMSDLIREVGRPLCVCACVCVLYDGTKL